MMVEFFFYVSGFFMMSKAARINEDTSKKRIGSTTADYVLSKYKALIPYTLYAVIVGIIASAIIQKMGYRQIIFNIANCWIDVLFLQMYGFYGVIITGVSWYLSAMIIAIMILFPFCVKFGRNVLPFFTLLSLLIYGFLSMTCGSLSNPGQWLGLCYKGTLRGIGSMSAGAVIWILVDDYTGLKSSAVVPAGIGLLMASVIMSFIYTAGQYDFIIAGLEFIGCLLLFMHKDTKEHRIFKTCRNFSTCLFLSNFYWATNLAALTNMPDTRKLILYFICTGVTALTMHIVVCNLILHLGVRRAA